MFGGMRLKEIAWRIAGWILDPMLKGRPRDLADVGDRVHLPGAGEGVVTEIWGVEGECYGWAEVKLDTGDFECSRREHLEKRA